MVVVDTSVLINYLRGDSLPEFEALVLNGEVLLSKVVKLELLSGVRKKEVKSLEILFEGLVELADFASSTLCEKLLNRARGRGLFGGLPDLMILADAVQNQARLFTHDEKQRALAVELRVGLF